MRPFLQEVGFVTLLLLNRSSGQSYCDNVVSEASGSSGVGIPVVGCASISASGQSGSSSSSASGGNVASTTTDTTGETIISNSGGVVTIPTGLTTLTTITKANGQITTYTPVPASRSDLTTTDSAGETVISNSGAVNTISTGLITPVVITESNGRQTTLSPSSASVSSKSGSSQRSSFQSGSSSSNAGLKTVNSATQTIVSNNAGVVTIPTAVTTPIVLTESNGQQTTYTPPTVAISFGSASSSPSSSSSSSSVAGLLIPVTTSVTSPKPTSKGSVIPCDIWFFSICINWRDTQIGGWNIDLPPGIYPPGPPPPFTSDPSLSISIRGKLPPWPHFTIGPNNVPTFPAKPTDGPNNGCNTKSGEFCATTTSFHVSTSGTITRTMTSKVESTCGTVYGCDVTGTSTSTSATSTCASATASGGCASSSTYPYVVYPKDGTNTDQVNAISSHLKQYVSDASRIHTSTTKSLGLNYWQLPLNDSAVDELRQVANVATVDPQCDPLCKNNNTCIICYDPTLSISYQDPASSALRFMSWPSVQPSPLDDKYYFDDSNGEGTTVYILDSGANLASPEFQNNRLVSNSNIRWIHIGTDEDGRQPNDDSYTPRDPTRESNVSAHGTAMLSLVAGNTLGVAKKANPVLVRMPRRTVHGRGFTREDFLNGLGAISDDLTASGSGVTAIVLLAIGYPREEFVRRNSNHEYVKDSAGQDIYDDFGWSTRCKALLAAIASKNALVIVGGGNNLGPVDVWPARFAKTSETNPLKALVVAGAISMDGQTIRYVDDPDNGLPHVFAPGLNVQVADGQPTAINKGQPYKNSRGTSDAAALTTGLAAYFLSLARSNKLPNNKAFHNTPVGLKNYIVSQAWVKASLNGRNPISIWNAVTVDQEQQACAWDPNAATKRLRNRDNTCPAPSSASASASSSARTSSTAPPATPTTALTEQPVVCNNEAGFPGHGDIDGPQEVDFAERFCIAVQANSDLIYAPSQWPSKPTGFNLTTADDHGINYSYLIQWVDGCVTTVPSINIMQPVPESAAYPCAGLLWNDYHGCKTNGGVGGSSQAGCVKYTFVGGLAGPPPCDKCTPITL